MSGNDLTISNVQQRDVGVYTISLGNQDKGLYKNLSYTLIFNGKPLSLKLIRIADPREMREYFCCSPVLWSVVTRVQFTGRQVAA